MNDFRPYRATPGFTLIELLVVIGVLALLIALVIGVASKAIRQQKVRNTQQIMQNVMLAIEQFATEDPLRNIYDQPGAESFGKYPPYQLQTPNNTWPAPAGSIALAVEPNPPTGSNALANRLHRDLGRRNGNVNDWVSIGAEREGRTYPDGLDDNRALAAYLQVFSPASARLIPENARKPLLPKAHDYVNPGGHGTTPGNDGVLDVLGIHDAWGVPLDYMIYAKLEWGVIENANGTESAGWKVVERRPVLRSRGVKREVYDAWVQSNTDPTQRTTQLSPASKWIFSEELPKPWLGGEPSQLADDGTIGFNGANLGGWVRVVGLAEDYAYRPDGDEQP